MVFEDTVNRANPVDGRVSMSNLCTEILQVSSPSYFSESLGFEETGHDISCNLGSQNIAKMIDGGDLGTPTRMAIRALTAVSEMSSIEAVPSVRKGNDAMHAIGLGQMNLHGLLAREGIRYDSPEALDFTSSYFAAIAYHAILASNEIAQERGRAFATFEKSTYADGSFFEKYVTRDWHPRTETVAGLFAKFGIVLPTVEDWKALKDRVMQHGIFNAYLQAIAPTGSISYINHSTSAIHPAEQLIEARKEGKTGLLYVPAPYLTNENKDVYGDAFSIGPNAIIDVYAAATEHIDQGAAMTLFFRRNMPDAEGKMRPVTTRDINRAQIYAYSKGIKTIYYIRMTDDKLDGMEDQAMCEACSI
jgi:ribonucleoside-diphosphate reductase alpha chain